MPARPTAVKKLAILPAIKLLIFLQGCRAKLQGRAARQGYRARLQGNCKAAGQGFRVRLLGKAAGQGCMAMVHAMVQYAESMVKLDNNAVFD
jgi:hypothetical protein